MLTLAQLKSQRSACSLNGTDCHRNELNRKFQYPLRKCQTIIELDLKTDSKTLGQTGGYRFIRVQSGLCRSDTDSDAEVHRMPNDARIRLGDFQTVYHFRHTLPELDNLVTDNDVEILFKVSHDLRFLRVNFPWCQYCNSRISVVLQKKGKQR